MKKPLIILTGPTAVGKTAVSTDLAKSVGGEIISADSMQVYKHMDIGTAKITREEMQGVKHYLIDELEPDEEFNIFMFQTRAKQAIDEITQRGHIPVIVGGTGFYIQSVVYDVDFGGGVSSNDISYREYLQRLARDGGGLKLHEMLALVDRQSAESIHPNNVKRVIRALEYYHQTGKPISEHNEEQRCNESPYNFAYFVLNDDRARIYERINTRVDMMLDSGLVDEVQSLKLAGYDRTCTSMQGIGYKEMLDYLDGRITLEEAVYIIKRDTRHFAKRQLTWFKREKDVVWVNLAELNNDRSRVLEFIFDILREKNIIGG